jgi:hypothetical protein
MLRNTSVLVASLYTGGGAARRRSWHTSAGCHLVSLAHNRCGAARRCATVWQVVTLYFGVLLYIERINSKFEISVILFRLLLKY